MKRTKKHHYLPQFYLTGFAIPGKPTHIWQIEKTENCKCYQVAIADAAAQGDYHTIVDGTGKRDSSSVEQTLSKLESQQAQLIKRIVQKKCFPHDRRRLAEFVSLMDMRVPATKDFIRKQYDSAFEAMNKVLQKGDRLEQTMIALPEFAKLPAHILKALANRMRKMNGDGAFSLSVPNAKPLDIMFDVAQNPVQVGIIERMGMTLFEAPPGCAFLTGDNPVVRFIPRTLPPGRPGVGFVDPDIQVTISLSARVLLRLDWSKAAMDYRQALIDEVAEFNRRVVISSHNVILSSSSSHETISAVKANAAYSAKSDIKLQHEDELGRVLMLTRTTPVFPAHLYEKS